MTAPTNPPPTAPQGRLLEYPTDLVNAVAAAEKAAELEGEQKPAYSVELDGVNLGHLKPGSATINGRAVSDLEAAETVNRLAKSRFS